MEQKPRILLVDDEEAIRSALANFLGRMGFHVQTAATGEHALACVETHEPDLILLDVVLNETDPTALSGLDVCRQLRKRDRFVPIIMLTSYPEWQVESLGQGAIAFITKPWDNNALVGQIRATLNAIQHVRREAPTPANSAQMLRVRDDIIIDLTHFRVSVGGQQVDFTPIEFALLTFFVRNPNRYWTREELLNHVWGYNWVGYARTVDRHVAAVRRKLRLERDELIETVHGVGYRFVQE
jgi:two-component system phosphate regulon response regulator PhoB